MAVKVGAPKELAPSKRYVTFCGDQGILTRTFQKKAEKVQKITTLVTAGAQTVCYILR